MSEQGSPHHGMIDRFRKLVCTACDGAGPASQVFGRLWPEQSEQPATGALAALADSMREPDDDPTADADTPLGMVFLGQFIDHDLTLDTTTRLGESSGDVGQIQNFRTPRLELDSVYLHGPEASPYLYVPGGQSGQHELIFGTDLFERDLQRNRFGTAIIGDPRNDENLFISQLHGLFIRAHNQLLRVLGGTNATLEQFEQARRTLRSLYQNVIVGEFLPHLVADDVLAPLVAGFHNGQLPGPVDWANAPDMPVEFSAAAYRFGHSQVRGRYLLRAGEERTLFEAPPFSPVEPRNEIDWKFFFDLDGSTYQRARRIDTLLAKDLLALPFATPSSLAERNLVRGAHTFHLPHGEDIARDVFGVAPIPKHPKVEAAGLAKTPLWFYILAEAEAAGGKLGTVGGTLVAGTILNLLLRGAESIARDSAKAAAAADAPIEPTMRGIAALASGDAA